MNMTNSINIDQGLGCWVKGEGWLLICSILSHKVVNFESYLTQLFFCVHFVDTITKIEYFIGDILDHKIFYGRKTLHNV